MLSPQAATVPSEHKARLWVAPAATETTVLPASTPVFVTNTGTLLSVVLLLPSWPYSLNPQAATVPSEHKARLWAAPAATETTVLPASTPLCVTRAGTWLSIVLLLPSWPYPLPPQAATVPSEHKARLWLNAPIHNPRPAATETTVLPASTPLCVTNTGSLLYVVLLLPSSPLSLSPQAAIVPSEHRARLC